MQEPYFIRVATNLLGISDRNRTLSFGNIDHPSNSRNSDNQGDEIERNIRSACCGYFLEVLNN